MEEILMDEYYHTVMTRISWYHDLMDAKPESPYLSFKIIDIHSLGLLKHTTIHNMYKSEFLCRAKHGGSNIPLVPRKLYSAPRLNSPPT